MSFNMGLSLPLNHPHSNLQMWLFVKKPPKGGRGRPSVLLELLPQCRPEKREPDCGKNMSIGQTSLGNRGNLINYGLCFRGTLKVGFGFPTQSGGHIPTRDICYQPYEPWARSRAFLGVLSRQPKSSSGSPFTDDTHRQIWVSWLVSYKTRQTRGQYINAKTRAQTCSST